MTLTTLPGTTIELPNAQYPVRQLLSSIFIPGGLVLSQISGLTGLTPHILQNWVKRGFIPRPVNKKYDITQFCRIAVMNTLKDNLQLEQITHLIDHACRSPNKKIAANVDATSLYCFFTDVLLHSKCSLEHIPYSIDKILTDYNEPHSGGKQKLTDIIHAMCTYYIASRIKQSAELLMNTLNQ